MSDLISRQGAIDFFLKKGMITSAIYVERMPSAQPEPSYEAIKEYCRKRCLSIVDTALLEKYEAWNRRAKDEAD